jgi:DNA-binding MarR family transcriptional regulator
LRRVRTGRDLTQQVLVDQLGVTRGNVSQLLSKLEAEGLVLRSPQGSAKVLRLTESGEAMVAELLPEHDHFIAECFSALSEAEQQQLVTLLSRLEDSLS